MTWYELPSQPKPFNSELSQTTIKYYNIQKYLIKTQTRFSHHKQYKQAATGSILSDDRINMSKCTKAVNISVPSAEPTFGTSRARLHSLLRLPDYLQQQLQWVEVGFLSIFDASGVGNLWLFEYDFGCGLGLLLKIECIHTDDIISFDFQFVLEMCDHSLYTFPAVSLTIERPFQ